MSFGVFEANISCAVSYSRGSHRLTTYLHVHHTQTDSILYVILHIDMHVKATTAVPMRCCKAG